MIPERRASYLSQSKQDAVQIDLSVLQHLKQNNEALPDVEARHVQDALEKMRTRIRDIDEEVARLQKERAQSERSLYHYSALSSHIRYLPAEILLEIFKSCEDHYDVLDVTTGPWSFERVCRQWRSVIVPCSGIWSSFSVDPVYSTRCYMDYVRPLDEALRRARQHNLSIIILPAEHCELEELIIQIIVSHSSRWHDILLCMSHTSLPSLAQAKGHLQSLRQFQLDIYDPNPMDEIPPGGFDFLQNAPQLRELDIQGVTDLTAMDIPWPLLTSFRTTCADLNRHHHILGSSPHLDTFKVDEYDSDFRSMSSGPHILHPVLRRLDICYEEILGFLTLPALAELTLNNTCLDGSRNVAPAAAASIFLKPLLHRSKCSLRKLCISNIVLDQSFFDVLRETDTITELSVIQPFFDKPSDSFMAVLFCALNPAHHSIQHRFDNDTDMFGVARNSAPILPRLESFSITLTERHAEVPMTFLDTASTYNIVGRWYPAPRPPNVSQLRLFHFTSNYWAVFPYLIDRSLGVLRKIKAEGLDISIVTLGNSAIYFRFYV